MLNQSSITARSEIEDDEKFYLHRIPDTRDEKPSCSEIEFEFCIIRPTESRGNQLCQ